MHPLNLRGFQIYQGFLSEESQNSLVAEIREIAKQAPLFQPETRFGRKMSVRMTAAGSYGWFSDRSGYRYIEAHPNGTAWPAIPQTVLDIWDQTTGAARQPECCLVNYYDAAAKMGMHQDKDEADFSFPVVSVSLGDTARFRIGNTTKGGSTDSIWLASGDVVVMGGPARLSYHGIDAIRYGSSRLLSQGGRLNLTLRVVR